MRYGWPLGLMVLLAGCLGSGGGTTTTDPEATDSDVVSYVVQMDSTGCTEMIYSRPTPIDEAKAMMPEGLEPIPQDAFLQRIGVAPDFDFPGKPNMPVTPIFTVGWQCTGPDGAPNWLHGSVIPVENIEFHGVHSPPHLVHFINLDGPDEYPMYLGGAYQQAAAEVGFAYQNISIPTFSLDVVADTLIQGSIELQSDGRSMGGMGPLGSFMSPVDMSLRAWTILPDGSLQFLDSDRTPATLFFGNQFASCDMPMGSLYAYIFDGCEPDDAAITIHGWDETMTLGVLPGLTIEDRR